jgi:hypothetical protein
MDRRRIGGNERIEFAEGVFYLSAVEFGDRNTFGLVNAQNPRPGITVPGVPTKRRSRRVAGGSAASLEPEKRPATNELEGRFY